jgi:hypothetical protein
MTRVDKFFRALALVRAHLVAAGGPADNVTDPAAVPEKIEATDGM